MVDIRYDTATDQVCARYCRVLGGIYFMLISWEWILLLFMNVTASLPHNVHSFFSAELVQKI